MAELDIVSKEVHPTPKVLMLELEGGVDDKSYPKLEKALKRTFKDGCCRLILNFANLRFLNEADKLLRYEKAFRKKGGGIVLYEVPARVKVKLETLEIHTKLKLHNSLKAAIAELSDGASQVADIAAEEPPKTERKKRKPKTKVKKAPAAAAMDSEPVEDEAPARKRKTTARKKTRKKAAPVADVDDEVEVDEPAEPKSKRKSTSRRRKKTDAAEPAESGGKRGQSGRSKRGQTGRRRRPRVDEDEPKKGSKLWIYVIEAVVVIGAAAAFFMLRK